MKKGQKLDREELKLFPLKITKSQHEYMKKKFAKNKKINGGSNFIRGLIDAEIVGTGTVEKLISDLFAAREALLNTNNKLYTESVLNRLNCRLKEYELFLQKE